MIKKMGRTLRESSRRAPGDQLWPLLQM